MVPNGAKQGQTGPNGVKRGQKSALRGQTWPKGPTEPNEAKWGHMWHARIFFMRVYWFVCKYETMQVFLFKSMKLSKYTSVQVSKYIGV